MLCFLHSKNIFKQKILFTVERSTVFFRRPRCFCFPTVRAAVAHSRVKERPNNKKKQMPLPAPVVEIEWSHSQVTQDGSDDKDWMRGSSLFKFIACLPVFSPLFSNPIYSFASSTGFWSSNLHFILFQYSGATGDLGSCVEQQRRPSKADATKAPFSWSLQNEWGQNSQNETAGLLQMSHWCHGHSHFPEGGRGGERETGCCN